MSKVVMLRTTKTNAALIRADGGDIVFYRARDGRISLNVRLEKESLWLAQKEMALLFDTERSVITRHINNIFASGELEQKSNVQKMHIAGSDKPVSFYSLEQIGDVHK